MTFYLCGVCGLVHNSLTDPPCPVPVDALFKTPSPPSPPSPSPAPPSPPVEPRLWISELRDRCAKAGYIELHIGRCDVLATWEKGAPEPRVKYHRAGGSDVPALWCIVHDLIGPTPSAWGGDHKHSVCFDRGRMTSEHCAALDSAAECAWVCEKYRGVAP